VVGGGCGGGVFCAVKEKGGAGLRGGKGGEKRQGAWVGGGVLGGESALGGDGLSTGRGGWCMGALQRRV